MSTQGEGNELELLLNGEPPSQGDGDNDVDGGDGDDKKCRVPPPAHHHIYLKRHCFCTKMENEQN